MIGPAEGLTHDLGSSFCNAVCCDWVRQSWEAGSRFIVPALGLERGSAIAGTTVAAGIVLGLLFLLKTSERCQSDRVRP